MKATDVSYEQAFKVFLQTYIDAGLPEDNWYHDAKLAVQELADFYSIDFSVVVAVVAVLSPAQRWDQVLIATDEDGKQIVKYPNLDSASGLIKLWQDGHDLDSAKWSKIAGYPDNKIKAWLILEFNDDIYLSGNKVESFKENIVNPDGYVFVTIDRWMLRAFLQQPNYPEKLLKGYQDKQYSELRDAIKSVAGIYNVIPSAVQAAIWNYTRYQAGENLRGWAPLVG